MKTAVFSVHKFEETYLLNANNSLHQLKLINKCLDKNTAVLANGCEAVSLFVSDDASAPVLDMLGKYGVKYISLRSAGFNHVDLGKAMELGIKVARVPGYSPYSVAEHAVALMLSLNRNIPKAHNRIMQKNFLLDGLTGFDMNGKTAGIIGTGKIGCTVAKILHGFGCTLLAYDTHVDETISEKYGLKYVSLETLLQQSDIISIHVPLVPATRYLINAKTIEQMKKGVMLINTARGGIVDTLAVIAAIKTGKIGYFGMDVYEYENALYFNDRSQEILQDDVFARLMSFDNVLITAHQAFLTNTALENIARTTIHNLTCFERQLASGNELI